MIDVNEYIGKPYELGARGPDRFDCWGLVMDVYAQLGRALPDWKSENDEPMKIARAMQAGVSDALENNHAVPVLEPRAFDIALLFRGNFAHHCGIYCFGGILHCSAHASGGTVHESKNKFIQSGRGFLSFYRWARG